MFVKLVERIKIKEWMVYHFVYNFFLSKISQDRRRLQQMYVFIFLLKFLLVFAAVAVAAAAAAVVVAVASCARFVFYGYRANHIICRTNLNYVTGFEKYFASSESEWFLDKRNLPQA